MGDGLEVERPADEIAQRYDQPRGADLAPGDHVRGSLRGEPHLILGAEQHHIRQRRFDRVARAPTAFERRVVERRRQHEALVRLLFEWLASREPTAHVAQMGRVHDELTGE
ncbi:hypothetical protein QEG98_35170 [Myxococcus sp. MxC21-1]|uniref:hypothetical protein n=1 Tax=Myxococcus sp. MxC21-1 TaxID=3041439 RepID=UPI00292DECB0|nr:hypothetical protein [Myxococcus sp. MxC21-1]WNZ61105.1 hypothetical protein QEG98_35170 [Myxococcus sp. MxC21-1]